jgi:hypothetical protein
VDYRPNFTIRQELTNGLALENGAMVVSVPAFGQTPVRFYRITAPQKFSAGASPLPIEEDPPGGRPVGHRSQTRNDRIPAAVNPFTEDSGFPCQSDPKTTSILLSGPQNRVSFLFPLPDPKNYGS